MTTRMRWATTVATLIGLAGGLWAIGRVGLRAIASVVLSAGAMGVASFIASYLVVLAILGGAWAVSMRGRERRRLAIFVAARAVREAVNDLLPFAQIGGVILGIRVLIAADMAPARVYCATIVDITTEMVAQLLLVLLGLSAALIVMSGDHRALAALAPVGLAVTIVLTLGLVLLQRSALRLASRLAGRLLPSARDAIDAVRAELAIFAARPGAMIPSLACNIAACLGSVLSAWIGLRAVGSDPPFWHILALEALIYTLRSGAFLIPGALGVQEAGYVLLGPLFGIDREAALALGLLKRARDIAVGVPTLLLWQGFEWRRRRPARGRSAATNPGR